MHKTALYDRTAAILSLSCIAHCVALPIVAVSLPFIAAIAEAEWVHWVLTAFSIAASATVIARAHDARKASFLVPAVAGILLLTVAVFAESFGIEETAPTVIGGLLLAAAHLGRLFKSH